MLSQCCVVVSTVGCVTVVCVWDPYFTVCCTVRVALTVYATVVPQYFRICDLYLVFRKLWHHTIRACTDLYRWLVRYTVRVTSTVYAIVS